jgi:hypothetical protein
LVITVNRVKLNFGATIITEHPFTQEAITQLMEEAQQMIKDEERRLAAGTDPEDWDSEENKAKYLKPVPQTKDGKKSMEKFREKAELEVIGHKQTRKMANLVELMKRQEQLLKEYGEEEGMQEENGVDMGLRQANKGACKQGLTPDKENKMSKTCTVL